MSEHDVDMHLPAPTVWPFVMGGGVTLAAFGVPTQLYWFCGLGVVLLAWGLVGWIQLLSRESHESHS
jgi:hypothetical protein